MSYEIIPQAPRYEMNNKGVIHNRETGKVLKWQISPHGTKTVQLYLGDRKKICVTQPHLLWQLHGRCTSKVADELFASRVCIDFLLQCPVVRKTSRARELEKPCSLAIIRYEHYLKRL